MIASMPPKMSCAVCPEAHRGFPHTRSPWPEHRMREVRLGLRKRRDRVPARDRALPEARDLGKHEPHPAAALAAGAQLCDGGRVCAALVLGCDESLIAPCGSCVSNGDGGDAFAWQATRRAGHRTAADPSMASIPAHGARRASSSCGPRVTKAIFRDVNEALPSRATFGKARRARRSPSSVRVRTTRGCSRLIELTATEYERIREHPRRFFVAPDHQVP